MCLTFWIKGSIVHFAFVPFFWSNFFWLNRMRALANLRNADCSKLMPCWKDCEVVFVCGGIFCSLTILMVVATMSLLSPPLLLDFCWIMLQVVIRPCLVESPIFIVEGILDYGQVRSVIMSDAAWGKILSVVMEGIEIVCGMKTSLSLSTYVLVEGMKHIMHL